MSRDRASTMRDLPIPASPCRRTAPPAPCRVRFQWSRSSPISSTRPISGLAPVARSAAVPDDDEARGDSCASFERPAVRPVCLSEALDNRHGGANGLPSIIFMGQRVPEIRKHAIAHELGKETVEPGYRAGADVLIAPDQRAHILWVYRVGQFRRADQIAKHDGDLAPLRLVRRAGAGWGFGRRRRCPQAEREFPCRDRAHELSPVSERKAELL